MKEIVNFKEFFFKLTFGSIVQYRSNRNTTFVVIVNASTNSNEPWFLIVKLMHIVLLTLVTFTNVGVHMASSDHSNFSIDHSIVNKNLSVFMSLRAVHGGEKARSLLL